LFFYLFTQFYTFPHVFERHTGRPVVTVFGGRLRIIFAGKAQKKFKAEAALPTRGQQRSQWEFQGSPMRAGSGNSGYPLREWA
jgi:hypothetical protein